MFLINIFPFFHGNQMLSFLFCERVRSSRLEMFLKIGVLKNFAIFTGKYLCWSLFLINIQTWRPATLLKRDANIAVFLWNLRSFYEHSFSQNTSSGCFSEYLMNSLFIAFENDEWCHFEVRSGSLALASFYCVCFVSFYFFLFFCFFVDSTTFWF